LGRFAFATPYRVQTNQGSFRVDHDRKFGGGFNRVSMNLFISRRNLFNPIGGSSGLGTGSNVDYRNDSFSLNDTHAFNANLLNQFTGGFTLNFVEGDNTVHEAKLATIGMTRFNESTVPGIPEMTFTDQLGGFGPVVDPRPHQHNAS